MASSRHIVAVGIGLVGAVALAGQAHAGTAADFYSGKTVSFVVGAGTGGGYDAYMRLLVQHMAKRLPGKPTAVVVNMPGGGGLKATNYVYNAAAKDGTYTVMPFFNHGVFQLIRPKGIKFDVRKMRWIGNMAELNSVIAVYSQAPVNSTQAAMKNEMILAASGKGSETYIYPAIYAALTGAKIKLVMGYRGTANMTVAMERGEVHGRGGSYMSWAALRPDWLRDKKVRFLAQAGLTKHPELPDVPLLQDLAKTPNDKAVVNLLSAPFKTSRAFAFPPGVPADRVTALRAAFDATIADPAFLADAKKRRMSIEASTGQEVEQSIAKMFQASKAVIASAQAMLEF